MKILKFKNKQKFKYSKKVIIHDLILLIFVGIHQFEKLKKQKVKFNIESIEQGDEWHKAGIENGGISIEDSPGIRDYGKFKMYLAYLRDPTGNKLCAGLTIK